jgi:hypothetical protein
MLVDVREFMEQPKRVRERRVPSLVRLELPQRAAMLRQYAVVSPGGARLTLTYLSREVSASISVNRKRNLPCIPLIFWVTCRAPDDCQLPRDVIEAGAKVVPDLTEQDAPERWRQLSIDVAIVASRLRLKLIGDSVRVFFQEARDLVVEGIDVFATPIELQPSPI